MRKDMTVDVPRLHKSPRLWGYEPTNPARELHNEFLRLRKAPPFLVYEPTNTESELPEGSSRDEDNKSPMLLIRE
ncbi:unnamed protein product [Echinostoma caproni]|uniref:Uncharacterized protein n=1 Tax=Echinostoma caproni TaxID=27848 RepID=A0A183B909_9TREM|nr:unnamed protein product [Echinostoma caproni]